MCTILNAGLTPAIREALAARHGLAVVSGHRRPEVSRPEKDIFEAFGQDVFSLRLMRERLPKEVYERIKNIGHNGHTLDPHDAMERLR